MSHALEDMAGRREKFQTVDPRYQQKLGQIGPTAPKVGTLDQGRIEPLGSALQDTTGRKEKVQAVDPRYQQRLAEIRPTAPKVGTLDRGRIDELGDALQDTAGRKEAFQTVDPRYQQKLAEIKSTVPEAKPLDPSRGEALKQAIAQDKIRQLERMLAKEKEEREKKELADVRDRATQLEKDAKAKIDQLEQPDKELLKKEHQEKLSQQKPLPKDSLAYWRRKLQNSETALQWATQRLSRRSLLARLKGEIAEQKVPGPFKDAFQQQAAREYTKIELPLLTAERQNTKDIMSAYRKALLDLVGAHKKVDDLDKKTGTKYGGAGVQSLMESVTATISNAGFDVTQDTPGLDDQIKAVREGVGKLGTSLRGRMEKARESETILSGHATKGQDPRGKKEETDAIQKAKDAFKEVQSKIKGREVGIDSNELAQLVDTTGVLTSFADRKKEKQAHDMKALYEAAPYHLDLNTSKVVHAERHTKKGGSGHKTADELEKDYKSEVDKQYIASKEIWCQYLGYTKGEGNARVTKNVGTHDGKPGHHSVFLGDYAAEVSAKDGKASDSAPDKTAAQLLNVLYPSAGTGGAHYTLEFTEPKPHAYRGGPVIPGARYQADRSANNAAWIAVRDFMSQKQQDEETRVRDLIQAALDDHMMVVHRKDPGRRK